MNIVSALAQVKKHVRHIVAGMAALSLTVGLAACGPQVSSSTSGSSSTASKSTRTLDDIKESGVLKVAVFTDKAPFGYVDKDGKNQGYDVYFAERLAKDLGVKIEYCLLYTSPSPRD